MRFFQLVLTGVVLGFAGELVFFRLLERFTRKEIS